MFKVFDYKCSNEQCNAFGEIKEIMHKPDDTPICEVCSEQLQKLPPGISTKHISWAQWRAL